MEKKFSIEYNLEKYYIKRQILIWDGPDHEVQHQKDIIKVNIAKKVNLENVIDLNVVQYQFHLIQKNIVTEVMNEILNQGK